MGAWGFITVASGKLELYVIYCLLFYANREGEDKEKQKCLLLPQVKR